MEIEKEAFQTSNLNEIAVLLASGKKFIKTEKEISSNQIVFYFQPDDCQSIVASYYNKEKVVSPFDFSQALQSAKDIIFGYKRR